MDAPNEQQQSTDWVEPLAYADALENLVDEDGFLSGSPAKDDPAGQDDPE